MSKRDSMPTLYKKYTSRNIHNHSFLAPELSDDTHGVSPFFVNLFESEFLKTLTPNFSVSKSVSPVLQNK